MCPNNKWVDRYTQEKKRIYIMHACIPMEAGEEKK